MIISIRRLLEGVKLLLLFVVCTFVFYSVVSFFTEVIQPADPYRKPEGKAVKVTSFYYQGVENFYYQETEASEWDWFKNRLMFYYWYGE